MKAYIQDLCGDEDTVVIDVAILQCMLQDAIFEKLVGQRTNEITQEEVVGAIRNVLHPYVTLPSVSINLTLRRGDEDEGYKVYWESKPTR